MYDGDGVTLLATLSASSDAMARNNISSASGTMYAACRYAACSIGTRHMLHDVLYAACFMPAVGCRASECDRIVRFTADASAEGEGFSAMYSDGDALPRTDPPTTVRRKDARTRCKLPQRVARRLRRYTLIRSGQCNTLRYTACTDTPTPLVSPAL